MRIRIRAGRFGPFGGRYVPETLVPALNRLQAGVDRYLRDPDFLAEFHGELEQLGRQADATDPCSRTVAALGC